MQSSVTVEQVVVVVVVREVQGSSEVKELGMIHFHFFHVHIQDSTGFEST